MMSKTLFISDLDGTLLDDSAELSEYTTSSLKAKISGGLHFTVATARTFATASIILSKLELKLPVILMNGVLIYDPRQKFYLQINALIPETVATIIQTLKNFNITGFMYTLGNNELATYYESLEQKPLRDFLDERVTKYGKTFTFTEDFQLVSPDNVIYFTLLDTHERLLPVYNEFTLRSDLGITFYKDNYSPDLWYLEIFSNKASKKNAIDYLRKEYGYEYIIGFGDNLNDLPMFAACDVRVAVENAKDEVRKAADHICAANIDDGVVKWLESYSTDIRLQ